MIQYEINWLSLKEILKLIKEVFDKKQQQKLVHEILYIISIVLSLKHWLKYRTGKHRVSLGFKIKHRVSSMGIASKVFNVLYRENMGCQTWGLGYEIL